ncbi:protein E7 [Elephant endotheliotropic herpesvirus 1A]|uniref:Protein E7 n=1 Tax=Elephant endotheliotropic herpesvirus 1A TaxID=759753 RepID=M1RFU2_ELHV1|nr:protein E7 [Elephant endotheliotropic herpesvirus 1A]
MDPRRSAGDHQYLIALGDDAVFYSYVLLAVFLVLFVLCCLVRRFIPAPDLSMLDPILLCLFTGLSIYHLVGEELASGGTVQLQWSDYFLECWLFYCYTVCVTTFFLYIIYHIFSRLHAYQTLPKLIRRICRRTFLYTSAMLLSLDMKSLRLYIRDDSTMLYVFVYLYIFVVLCNTLSELVDKVANSLIEKSTVNALLLAGFVIVHQQYCAINTGIKLNGNVFTFMFATYGLSNQIMSM